MAIPTPKDLRDRFKEFASTDQPTLQVVIDEAARGVDPTAWGDREEDAILYLAAHALTRGPFGHDARIDSKDAEELKTTTYGARFLQMRGENRGRTFDSRLL